MNKYFKYLFNKLTINKYFIYSNSLDNLHELMNNNINIDIKARPFYINKISADSYELIAYWSIGIMTGAIKKVEIRVYMTIIESSVYECTIRTTTKIRPENGFILLMLIVSLYGCAASNQPYYTYLFVLLVMLAIFLWFHFIYKMQEHSIISYLYRMLLLKETTCESSN